MSSPSRKVSLDVLKMTFAERLQNGNMHPLMTNLYTVYCIIKAVVFALILLNDLTKLSKSVILALRASKSTHVDSPETMEEHNAVH